MAKHYALIVDHPGKQCTFIKGINVRAHKDDFQRRENRMLHPHEHRKIEKMIDDRTQAHPVGALHAHADSLECPDGLPNCRNCGDPAYTVSCRANDHCPKCGIDHGMIPDAQIIEGGYQLLELTGEQADLAKRHHKGESEWDSDQRQFVARQPVFAHTPESIQ